MNGKAGQLYLDVITNTVGDLEFFTEQFKNVQYQIALGRLKELKI